MGKRLGLLLVDFDGVLSNGRFYHVPDSVHDEIGRAAAKILFSSESSDLANRWMRGELTYAAVHDHIEHQSGIDARLLDDLLKESVKHMPLNPSLLRFVSLLRSRGVTVSLFTDNMDIFDVIARKYHALDDHFDYIYSSSSYGQLKLENEVLLHRAINEAKADVGDTVLVDDSPNSLTQATGYGVETFLYDQYETSQLAFEQWLEREYAW